MSFEDDRERRRKADHPVDSDASTRPARKRRKRAEPGEIGHALRSIYNSTVGEPIPAEMLDLLGKLG